MTKSHISTIARPETRVLWCPRYLEIAGIGPWYTSGVIPHDWSAVKTATLVLRSSDSDTLQNLDIQLSWGPVGGPTTVWNVVDIASTYTLDADYIKRIESVHLFNGTLLDTVGGGVALAPPVAAHDAFSFEFQNWEAAQTIIVYGLELTYR